MRNYFMFKLHKLQSRGGKEKNCSFVVGNVKSRARKNAKGILRA